MYPYHTPITTIEAAPHTLPFHGITRPNTRSFRNKEQPQKPCPDGFNGNGFLKHRFLPLVNGYSEEIRSQGEVERDFFLSASHLCSLYGVDWQSCPDWPYPKNIALAIDELTSKISALDKDINLIVVSDDDSSACLATVKIFDTKTTLYYLPVEPLYRLLKDGHRKATAELLLSVVAYFYLVGGIPYHTESSSYLYYVYDRVAEWSLEEDCFEEPEQQEFTLNHFAFMENAGAWLLEQIKQSRNLKLLAKRIERFKPCTQADKNLAVIADRIDRMMRAYPDRSIMNSIHDGLFETEEDAERIYAEQYLSFMWSFEDCLYDGLMDAVNSELQEFNEIDEPLTLQLFCSPQYAVSHDHSFETEFFDLLNDLSDNLNEFSHEKNNQTL